MSTSMAVAISSKQFSIVARDHLIRQVYTADHKTAKVKHGGSYDRLGRNSIVDD